MSTTPTSWDPYKEMLSFLDDAERKRFRITHWKMNFEAIKRIAMHPITASIDDRRPIAEREFLGIPVKIVQPGGPDAILRPAYQKWGYSTIVYDHDDEIIHGNCHFHLPHGDSFTTTVTA